MGSTARLRSSDGPRLLPSRSGQANNSRVTACATSTRPAGSPSAANNRVVLAGGAMRHLIWNTPVPSPNSGCGAACNATSSPPPSAPPQADGDPPRSWSSRLVKTTVSSLFFDGAQNRRTAAASSPAAVAGSKRMKCLVIWTHSKRALCFALTQPSRSVNTQQMGRPPRNKTVSKTFSRKRRPSRDPCWPWQSDSHRSMYLRMPTRSRPRERRSRSFLQRSAVLAHFCSVGLRAASSRKDVATSGPTGKISARPRLRLGEGRRRVGHLRRTRARCPARRASAFSRLARPRGRPRRCCPPSGGWAEADVGRNSMRARARRSVADCRVDGASRRAASCNACRVACAHPRSTGCVPTGLSAHRLERVCSQRVPPAWSSDSAHTHALDLAAVLGLVRTILNGHEVRRRAAAGRDC